MSFHASAHDIHLKHGHILCAKLKRKDGSEAHSEIDLDEYIGNSDGYFIWDGKGFSSSAEEIDLHHTHEGPKLVAYLRKRNGELSTHMGILLSERISNVDGRLVL